MSVPIFLLFVLCDVFGHEPKHKNDHSKRILLSDPDVLGARLRALEGSMHKVESKLLQQEQTIGALQKELAEEKAKHKLDLMTANIGHGSTYIRWGRNECSAVNTELVYSGYAAGEKYYYSSSYKGGASNMLCLPTDPELSNKTAGGSSQIFGTEFEENYFGSDHDSVNEDVPCALCRSTNTTSSVMFPARRTCYSGWKEEYRGILAASAYSHNPSPYICVDSHPTYVTGGQRSNDEHYLYVTKMKCGSLPCPPYKDNLQVLCVVCSK